MELQCQAICFTRSIAFVSRERGQEAFRDKELKEAISTAIVATFPGLRRVDLASAALEVVRRAQLCQTLLFCHGAHVLIVFGNSQEPSQMTRYLLKMGARLGGV